MSASGIGVVDLSSRSGWTGLLKAGERHSSPLTPPGLPWLALHTLTQCAVWRPIGRLGHWHPGSAKVAAPAACHMERQTHVLKAATLSYSRLQMPAVYDHTVCAWEVRGYWDPPSRPDRC